MAWKTVLIPSGAIFDMPDQTDFVTLYEELGLDAECSMEDFKRTYRKRVWQLHPDHAGHNAGMRRLQRLNRMYESALEFHQSYGRLPGAALQIRQPAMAQASATAPALPLAEEGHALPSGPKYWRRYSITVALAALLLYWLGEPYQGASSLDPAGPGDKVAPGLLAPEAPRLSIGMNQEQVLHILGEPDDEYDASHWSYGASWIEFECSKVIGWYNSPQHPLRVNEPGTQAALPKC
jgi:hypothetical protein